MEAKFINQYEVTIEMIQQWEAHPVGRKAVHDHKIGIHLRIAIICCGLLLILCSVLTQEILFTLFGILAIFIGLARLFLLPKLVLKKQYALILKSQNADAWLNQFTFSDEIVYESGNTSSRYAYSDIINVTEDRQYFYLFYNEDMVLRIYKAGFVLGTAEGFREFCRDVIKK